MHKLQDKNVLFFPLLLTLIFTSNVHAMSEESLWTDVPKNHVLFNFPLSSLGENMFWAIFDVLPDSFLDEAAKLGKRDDEIIDVIDSNDFESIEQIISAIEDIEPFRNVFDIKSFQIVFKGKGIITHGYFFKEANPGSYYEDITLAQLPYASLNTMKKILDRNEIYISQKLRSEIKCSLRSLRKNIKNNTFLLEGKISVKLYTNGHSYKELGHEIAIELNQR